jgi:excinuclease ABC subunit B
MQYKRSVIDFVRASFRVRGDIVEVMPANYSNAAIRIEFFGDTVEKLSEIDLVTQRPVSRLKHTMIFPANHYVLDRDDLDACLDEIRNDLVVQKDKFLLENRLIEAQRINERVNYDLEMIREIGYCSGIENYSRYFEKRAPGTPPYTLLDFFPEDFICFVDESHITLPQIRGMYNGDKARKANLIDYGFRLPAARDNRPLTFDEFDGKIGQMICVSATPGEYELGRAAQIAEQIIRPTGLVDPEIFVRKTDGQIDDLIGEINAVTERGGRTLVTTLTKKMAESLTAFFTDHGIKVRYMHYDIDTLERIEIITALRKGEFDVLVGINLLREGLDIPEVMLVAILDADKEGFLRSDRSLIQTVGRAARNSESKVIFYADKITGSMQRAMDETARRRELQQSYNKLHGITPKTIIKAVKNTIEMTKQIDLDDDGTLSARDITREIERIKGLMQTAASALDFESAIKLRDEMARLKRLR